MKAVILAAGKGERLRPLTDTRPKHLIPIGGRPLLEWTIRGLKEAGADEILLVTHYMEDMIRGYFRDGSGFGVEVSYARQDEMLGTADAFRVAEDFSGGDEFIGLYGDGFVTSETFRSIIDAHGEGETTLGVIPVEDPSRLAAVELDGDRVIRLVEKPPKGKAPSNLANTGIYVFTPDIFDHIKKTDLSERGEYEVTDSIGSLIEAGAPVKAAVLPKEGWMDVGQPWDILEANTRALQGLTPSKKGVVEQGVSLHGPVHIGEGTRIRTGAYIEGPVYIGPGCDIGPNCYVRSSTSIGAGVRIGNACEIKNSIVMEGTHVAHLSYVGDSVIGAGCNFGAGTVTANIRFDKRDIRVNVKNERISSGRRKLGVIMGDNAQTGINVSLLPGVKIGSEAWITPGLTVYEDVAPGTFLAVDGPRPRKDS